MRTARHLTALLLALSVALAPAPVFARGKHILWTVQGKQNTVYLLGSIHVLRAGDAALSDVAERAYDDAEQLVMEVDLDDPGETDPMAMLEVMQRKALLPEGQSLRGVLGSDYDSVNRRAQQAGLDLALFDGFAPWMVATTLLQLELAKRGFSPEFGIEQVLARRAAGDEKPVQGLETTAQQLEMLAGMPMPMQKRFLVMTLDDSAQIDEEIGELVGAWQAGDTDALAALLSDEFDEFPDLYRRLTVDRNRAWVGRLADLLDDRDDYLVVVGALHLVGENSVVDLLEQRGYEVVQQ
jgi:uncharacterized protein YbaP (TraB family)